MREIKFRIFDGKQMQEVGVIDFDGYKSMDYYNWYDGYSGENYSFEKYPLMQFTGLKDKNGKEIFEGDIVRFLDGECTSTESGMDCDEFESIGEIVWEGYHWDVTNRNGIDTEEAFSGEFEVIGNVYSNPELLKCDR